MGLMMYLARLKAENLLRLAFAAYLAICLLFLFSPQVKAKSYSRQKPAEIEQAIKQHVRKHFSAQFKVETIVNKLDPYIRLQKCAMPLDVFYPARSKQMGPTTVGVQCLSGKPWKIYIPIQVKVFGPTVISKQPLPRGTFLSEADLELANREISSAMHGYFTSLSDIKGMVLKYSVAQGQIIGPGTLKPHHLVKRGDIVTVIAETNGLQIQLKGKALMNGYHGQSIRVKNTRSNRILQGEVVAARTVRIKL